MAKEALTPNQQYEILAEVIPSIVWTAQPDGYVDYYNQRWYDYTGLTWEQSDRYGASLVMAAEDYARTLREWHHAIATGETYEIEYRIRRSSDQSYRWHLGRALPLRDSSGRILKWFGSCNDIHDQKMAQEQMARSKEDLELRVAERTNELEKALEKNRIHSARLYSVIDSMALGAVLLAEDSTILRVNERFCQLFDLPLEPAKIMGMPGDELLTIALERVSYPDLYRQRIMDMVRDGVPQIGTEVLLQDGRVLSRDYLPVMVDAQPRGHLFLYRDITKERRLDAAKSEFMSLASHQLRTPLTAIRWALGRLSKQYEGANESTTGLLNAAKQAAIHMADTITTMLSISRIEAGTVPLDNKKLRLCTLLEKLEVQFREEYKSRSQQFAMDCAPDIELHTDENVLREILSNLLSNAVKYTPAGGKIYVCARQEEQVVVIQVTDTGCGIPTYQHEKIFTKFFRADNVIQMHTDGTGLGLYLVYRLVRTLGGTVSFDSREGEGTMFQVVLPARAS